MDLLIKGETEKYESLYHIHMPDDNYNRTVLQLYIPTLMKEEVLSILHDDKYAGHLGWTKTYAKAIQFYYWPNMKADIQKYCNSCDVCNRRKTPKHTAILPMLSPQQDLIGMNNMDAIAMDVSPPVETDIV
jgi:hypothetical protein